MYRRRYRGWGSLSNYEDNRTPQKVQVSIQWDNITNAAYKLKFDQIGKHWNKVQPIIDLIKTSIASSDREYDKETKTWFLAEKHIASIKAVCEAIPEFEVIFIEKPEQVAAQRFHNKEDDYAEFKRLISFAHLSIDDGADLSTAIKIFRKAAMLLHPDRNPNMASEMSALNEVFSRLKQNYWKEKEETNARN